MWLLFQSFYPVFLGCEERGRGTQVSLDLPRNSGLPIVRTALNIFLQGTGDSVLSWEPCTWPHIPLGHDKLINAYVMNAFKGKLFWNLMSTCVFSLSLVTQTILTARMVLWCSWQLTLKSPCKISKIKMISPPSYDPFIWGVEWDPWVLMQDFEQTLSSFLRKIRILCPGPSDALFHLNVGLLFT